MWLLINRARAEPDGSTTQKWEQHYPNLGQELSGHRTWLISNCLPPALALVAVLPCVPRLNNKTVSDQRSFWRTRSDSDPGIPISARLEEKKKKHFFEFGLDDSEVLWENCFGDILFRSEHPATRSLLTACQYTDFVSISNSIDP